jgi:hypothetical protein
MATEVRENPAATRPVAKDSLELPQAQLDSEELSAKPAWIRELGKRWRRHHQNGLQLRFETGCEINEQLGPTNQRQPRNAEVVKILSIELRLDSSEISRLRHFAELASDFSEFEAEHPDCRTWSQVKSLLAGQGVSESSDEDDEQPPEVRGLILRIRNTTLALKKQKLVVCGTDKTELLLELQKLSTMLAKRANVQLIVSHLPEEVAA